MESIKRRFFYSGLKLHFKLLHTLLPQGGRLYGVENLPDGAKIIAANHANATDAFHLPLHFKEQLYFIVQHDLLHIPSFGWCLWGSGQIPVLPDRKHLAIIRACEELAQGHTVIIFPEGKLNPNYEAMKGSSGALRMSLITGAPIIPMGTFLPDTNLFSFKLHTRGNGRQGMWQKRGYCYFHFGKPWYPAAEFESDIARAPLGMLTRMMMEKIYQQVELARQECLADGFQPVAAFPLAEPAFPPAEGD